MCYSLSRNSYLKSFGNRFKKEIAIGDISVLFLQPLWLLLFKIITYFTCEKTDANKGVYGFRFNGGHIFYSRSLNVCTWCTHPPSFLLIEISLLHSDVFNLWSSVTGFTLLHKWPFYVSALPASDILPGHI